MRYQYIFDKSERAGIIPNTDNTKKRKVGKPPLVDGKVVIGTSIQLFPDQRDELKKLAKEMNVSQAEIVRLAINEFIHNRTEMQAQVY